MQADERAVRPSNLREKCAVCPGFDDSSRLHHGNHVRPLDGGEAVGDHDRRATDHETIQRLLDDTLGFRIESGRGLGVGGGGWGGMGVVAWKMAVGFVCFDQCRRCGYGQIEE